MMPSVRSLVFPATYRDSVFLMQLSGQAREKCGAHRISAIMGSARNKDLLARTGLFAEELVRAGPDDLAVVIEAPEDVLDACEAVVRSLLAEPTPRPEGVPEAAPLPHTLEAALEARPDSRLAIISVPGDYARYEAAQALSLGLDVLLYSDGVSLEDERALKELARLKGRLLMGPDCGTAIVRNVPLGFSNHVRRSLVGLVGSSSTGLQEVSCLLDRCGLGISHAYGTGGRDVWDAVGGITTLAALERLAVDPETEVIAVIAKNPGHAVREALAAAYARLKKPVVVRYLGVTEYAMEKKAGARPATDLASLARQAAMTVAPMLDLDAIDEERPPVPGLPGKSPRARKAGSIRGVFSGGTFCIEAAEIVANLLAPAARGNVAAHEERSGAAPGTVSLGEHIFTDMGAPAFTAGRPHPLISPEIKMERIFSELMDPATSVLLTDIVLGYGASPQQVPVLIQTIGRAAAASRGESRKKSVIASVCGTENDDPPRAAQCALLRQAGVHVAGNNAQAARWAAAMAASGREERNHG